MSDKLPKEHLVRILEELRKRLIIMLAVMLVGAVACFIYAEEIRHLLLLPGAGLEMDLVYLNPSEALMANLRLAFAAGALVTLPVLLYQAVALVTVIARKAKKGAFFLTAAMYVLFGLGISFAYFVVFPFALNFFLSFSDEFLLPKFSVMQYVAFTTSFIFAFGLVFQLPLVFWFLGSIGVVDTAFLRRNRKFALLIILIFAAVLTPPDIFSQVMMAVPLLLLYELGILLVHFGRRRRKNIYAG